MQVAMFTIDLVIFNKGSLTYFLSLHMSIGKMKYNDICEPLLHSSKNLGLGGKFLTTLNISYVAHML